MQTAVKLVIEPIFEAGVSDTKLRVPPATRCQRGAARGRSVLKAGYTYVVDADLANYFDSIPHGRLTRRVRERVSDGRLLALIERWSTKTSWQGCSGGRRPVVPRKGRSSVRCWLTSIFTRWIFRWGSGVIAWCAMLTTAWCCAASATKPGRHWTNDECGSRPMG